MTSQRLAPARRHTVWVAAACVTVAVAGAFIYALVLMRVHFSAQDDEGVMLITLRQYVEGLPLYERYDGYGPFYYVLLGNLFAFAAVTHDALRLITIVFWLLVAAGWATCVWLWRRSLAWTVTTFLATINILRPLTWEPGHPHSLVLLLYAATFVAASCYSTSPAVAFAVIGAASAAMLLTKINVGVFLVGALVAVFIACLGPHRRPRVLDLGVRALCMLLPAVLMHAQLTNPITALQCAIYAFGIWAVLDALHRNARPDLDWSALGWAAVGFLGTMLLTIGTVYLRGTSVTALIDGVVLKPLRFSGAVPFATPRVTFEVHLGLGLLGAVLWIYQRFRGGIPGYFRLVLALVVIIAAIAIPRLATIIAPGLMWMFVPEPGGRLWKPTSRVPVSLVSVAASFGILMVYPVPGSQQSIAAAIIVLGAFSALLNSPEKLLQVVARWRIVAAPEWVLCGLILYATLIPSAWQVTQALEKRPHRAEYLPHSKLIQLSKEDYQTFAEISSRASARCDALVTIPGMNSFNIWSNRPHPNGAIISSAMPLFDETVQEQLVKDFLATSRPCVIWNSRLVQWSSDYRPRLPREPFLDLVRNQLVRVYERNGYEIRVPSNQASQWH